MTRQLKEQNETPDLTAQFLENVAEFKTYEDVIDELNRCVLALGCDGFNYSTYSRETFRDLKRGKRPPRESIVVTSRGPIELKAFEIIYGQSELILNDPGILRSGESTTSFTTEDVYRNRRLKAIDRENLALCQKYGFHYDLYVPIHTPNRIQVLYFYILGESPDRKNIIESARATLEKLAEVFARCIVEFVKFPFESQSSVNLSIREQQCLALVALGASNVEISQKLDISERTVKFHVENTMGKFGVHSRTQLVAMAMRANLITT